MHVGTQWIQSSEAQWKLSGTWWNFQFYTKRASNLSFNVILGQSLLCKATFSCSFLSNFQFIKVSSPNIIFLQLLLLFYFLTDNDLVAQRVKSLLQQHLHILLEPCLKWEPKLKLEERKTKESEFRENLLQSNIPYLQSCWSSPIHEFHTSILHIETQVNVPNTYRGGRWIGRGRWKHSLLL